jgi:hypothetical protein
MAIYLVLLAQLVFLVLFSLGQQWLGVNEKILQMPNRGWGLGPTERCPTCGEATCRRVPWVFGPLPIQVLSIEWIQ